MEQNQSPFKEVKIAADYLRSMANLLSFELHYFRFEEFQKDDDGTLKISFSYKQSDSYLNNDTVYKTLFVKNDEVIAVRTGTLAAVNRCN